MTDTTMSADPATRALQMLAEVLGAMPAPVILCLGCVSERVQAATSGASPEDWPAVGFAALIVNGMGQCLRHVQFTNRPLVPGQLPSGIVLPGQGV